MSDLPRALDVRGFGTEKLIQRPQSTHSGRSPLKLGAGINVCSREGCRRTRHIEDAGFRRGTGRNSPSHRPALWYTFGTQSGTYVGTHAQSDHSKINNLQHEMASRNISHPCSKAADQARNFNDGVVALCRRIGVWYTRVLSACLRCRLYRASRRVRFRASRVGPSSTELGGRLRSRQMGRAT